MNRQAYPPLVSHVLALEKRETILYKKLFLLDYQNINNLIDIQYKKNKVILIKF